MTDHRLMTRPSRIFDLHFCWRELDGQLEFALLNGDGTVDEETWHVADERTHSPAVLADMKARLGMTKERRRCVLRDWLFSKENW